LKRPLAYITSAWGGCDLENKENAAKFSRAVYEAGFSPICPILFMPLFLNDEIPEEHKSGVDMGRDLLRRSHVLVVCGKKADEAVKSDIATAARLKITATTLDGILTVKMQGQGKANG
jgi:hypothetical protein